MNEVWWKQSIHPVNQAGADEAAERQNILTKPPGSLGKTEQLAIYLAGLRQDGKPEVKKPEIVIFAGDHGVVAQGVSAFPQEVTVEMLRNFVDGGAAISVLAEENQAGLSVVNCGTVSPAGFSGVIDRRIAPGTGDISVTPAMTEEQCENALAVGAEMVMAAKERGTDLFIAGEMGIGNTTPASALGCALTGTPVSDMTGRGTGIDDTALERKQRIIQTSLERVASSDNDPYRILCELGGFEIAAMCGAYIKCAQTGIPALVDGFITTSAALVACRLNPEVRNWLLFSHRSEEPGHNHMLKALDADPLLSLNLRLGEGSGAALTLPLLRQACALHNRMATFAEASVSGAQS